MSLNEEQINEIIDMAKLFFSVTDIAVNIEVDPEEFKTSILIGEGEAYRAYKKGRLLAEIPLRKAIARASENGSNPAQMKMLELMKDADIDLEL